VVGITVYAIIVISLIGSYSVIAGAIALSFILIPIVSRTTEESLKLVPTTVREASLALGVYKWRTTLSIVIPTGLKGVITGALIAIARVAGETAPLIMTVLGSRYFFQGLTSPMAALPLEIFRDAQQPYASVQGMGWGAALVLILMVLILNIIVRWATRKKR
jgi:phosphate transport system permease protein